MPLMGCLPNQGKGGGELASGATVTADERALAAGAGLVGGVILVCLMIGRAMLAAKAAALGAAPASGLAAVAAILTARAQARNAISTADVGGAHGVSGGLRAAHLRRYWRAASHHSAVPKAPAEPWVSRRGQVESRS